MVNAQEGQKPATGRDGYYKIWGIAETARRMNLAIYG